jgi:trimeric autotransporter adhesin
MKKLPEENATKPMSILIVTAVFAWFGLCGTPNIFGVVPAPDGGYPNFNTAEGQNALLGLTTGAANTAVGSFSLESVTTGSFNTGVGADTLVLNTGDDNTATGAAALLLNTTGTDNTANGTAALVNNSTGSDNTAVGAFALNSNTIGEQNTANGAFTLFSNTEGVQNTATGRQALFSNTTGSFNDATGRNALFSNTTGDSNSATGFAALRANTTGSNNTAVGVVSLFTNITGGGNTAVGTDALSDNTTGDDNTALGQLAGRDITGSGNVCIGEQVFGEAGVDDSTYIRNVNTLSQNFSAGVNNYVTVRLSDGRLGHTAVVSSQRYKEDIKPLDTASHSLYALKPVSFRLKKQFDPSQALGFGLIAEEVEKVDPALVYRNGGGQVESVRYDMVNAMLLNEFLKEHKKVQELEAIVAQQEKSFARQQAQIETLGSCLQKVTTQIEINSTASQMVLNNP